jgi:hypothetical protein
MDTKLPSGATGHLYEPVENLLTYYAGLRHVDSVNELLTACELFLSKTRDNVACHPIPDGSAD